MPHAEGLKCIQKEWIVNFCIEFDWLRCRIFLEENEWIGHVKTGGGYPQLTEQLGWYWLGSVSDNVGTVMIVSVCLQPQLDGIWCHSNWAGTSAQYCDLPPSVRFAEGSGLQGCDTVSLAEWLPPFRRHLQCQKVHEKLFLNCLTLKMAALRCFETSGPEPNTWRHIPEHLNHQVRLSRFEKFNFEKYWCKDLTGLERKCW